MASRAGSKQRVVRVDQSPMNAVIWVIQLACGHDVCVTQKRRPSTMRTFTKNGERFTAAKFIICPRCVAHPVVSPRTET